ncbi:MAG: DUF1059 domain-containing protein [Candidatus Doudnabacteria bacterium]
MKKLTCLQMAGACDFEISAETFEEAVKKAQEHGMGMADDTAHQEAMAKVINMTPEEQFQMAASVREVWDQADEV